MTDLLTTPPAAVHGLGTPTTPYLELDVPAAVASYRRLAAALPGTALHYAVKANPEPALLAALAQGGRDAHVGDAALVQLGRVEVDSPLLAAVQRLREGGEPCLQVMDGPSPVGLLTLENVGEFLMIRSALGEVSGGKPRPAPVGV